MAFGQGQLLPIQILTSFNSVVNGGKLYRPYLIDKITDSDGVVIKRFNNTKVRNTISEKFQLR